MGKGEAIFLGDFQADAAPDGSLNISEVGRALIFRCVDRDIEAVLKVSHVAFVGDRDAVDLGHLELGAGSDLIAHQLHLTFTRVGVAVGVDGEAVLEVVIRSPVVDGGRQLAELLMRGADGRGGLEHVTGHLELRVGAVAAAAQVGLDVVGEGVHVPLVVETHGVGVWCVDGDRSTNSLLSIGKLGVPGENPSVVFYSAFISETF